MSDANAEAVDAYLCSSLIAPDEVLDAALNSSATAGLPAINVAPNQGKLLQLIARSIGATRILEVGTLGGYSTIWLARALLPGGKLITLEFDPHHADVARSNLERAGLSGVVEVRVGAALESLAQLAAENAAPFDLVFIDADKENNAAYVSRAIELGRPGTVVIVDNVVRGGAILDPSDTDTAAHGVRALMEAVRHESRLDATAVQTIGSKGHDGFLLGLVVGEAPDVSTPDQQSG